MKTKKKILSVVGARPNFMKMASIHRACLSSEHKASLIHRVVHTGQHFSPEMSAEVFEDLGLPAPDVHLDISGGSSLEQVAKGILALEGAFQTEKPDLVLVYGDVNSTAAAAIAATRLGIPTAHVEAGLRSRDRTMPEELNRMLADSVSDLAFVTERSGLENLKAEGWAEERIHFVGNTMIDSLIHVLAKSAGPSPRDKRTLVCTLHRPSNVDSRDQLEPLLRELGSLSDEFEIILPLHPRTRNSIEKLGLELALKRFTISPPMRYAQFVRAVKDAAGVLTDSGGIQEETSYLGVPCITLRENTERPVTVEVGTNTLLPPATSELAPKIRQLLARPKAHRIPELWDGHAGERVIGRCAEFLEV